MNLLPLPTAAVAPRTALRSPTSRIRRRRKSIIASAPGRRSSGTFAWYHSDEPGPNSTAGCRGIRGRFSIPRTVNVLALNDVLTPTIGRCWRSDTDSCAFATILCRAIGRDEPGIFSGVRRAIRGFPASSRRVRLLGTLFDGGAHTDSSLYSHSVNVSFSAPARSPHRQGRAAIIGGSGCASLPPATRMASFNFTPGSRKGPIPTSGAPRPATPSPACCSAFPQRRRSTSRRQTTSSPTTSPPTFRTTSGCASTSRQSWRALRIRAGPQERNDAFTVGFDRDRPFPVQVPGSNLQGGLMYAGVDGYPTYQGNPSQLNFGPRAGIAWSLDSRNGRSRRLRAVLGAVADCAGARPGCARHARLHGCDHLSSRASTAG